MTYDGFLLLSFGGPERPEDVMPFLENVTRGRGVPPARLEAVAEHYHLLGGRSPINDQNRALLAAIGTELAARGRDLPSYFGNRNWHPFLADTLRDMRAAGIQRALAFVTSAYGSYSGCRQYRDDVARARDEVGEGAPEITILRKFFDHPGFVDPNADRVREALARIPAGLRDEARVIFTAHSIPVAMANASPYEAQLHETARLVADRVGVSTWDLAYQSRSGPPHVPWLEPDVLDHLRALRAEGTRAVVVAPIGFVTDHMEVVYDLDHEAHDLARGLGLAFERASTAAADPRFPKMVVDLIEERLAHTEKKHLSTLGPAPDSCPPTCCT